MTPDELRAAGRLLYGSCWQTDMARALGVALRNIQRWASGERGVPSGMPGDIAKLAGERIDELMSLTKRMRKG